MDTWTTQAAYEAFRDCWAQEYAEIDRQCEGLTARETSLGALVLIDAKNA